MTAILNWLCGCKTKIDTDRNSSIGLLVLRVFLGLTMAFSHGWGKLTNFSEIARSSPIRLVSVPGCHSGWSCSRSFSARSPWHSA